MQQLKGGKAAALPDKQKRTWREQRRAQQCAQRLVTLPKRVKYNRAAHQWTITVFNRSERTEFMASHRREYSPAVAWAANLAICHGKNR